MRVKICGLTSTEEVQAAVESGADAVGFVTEVDTGTHRDLDRYNAADLSGETPPFVSTVAVTLNSSVDELVGIDRVVNPDFLQIHGSYSKEEIASLSDQIQSRVIRALSPDEFSEEDLSHVSGVLVDTYTESGAGGTGETHDWEASRSVVEESSLPVVLAGGLDVDNVEEAVEAVRPYGVDVSSGVEVDESKDSDLISEFVYRAKRTGESINV